MLQKLKKILISKNLVFLFAFFSDVNSTCCQVTHENRVILMVVASFGYQIQGLLLTVLKQNYCISFIRDKIRAFLNFCDFILQNLW